jgi:hypothetical protein
MMRSLRGDPRASTHSDQVPLRPTTPP